jgi:PAP2 superfamily
MYKNLALIVLSLAFMAILGFIYTSINNKNRENLPSQMLMQKSMQIVREKKPTPVQASFYYAVIADKYYNLVYIKASKQETKYSYNQGEYDDLFATTTLQNILEDIINKDDKNSEGFKLKTGKENWNMVSGWSRENKKPFSPKGADLPRFIIDDNFTYVTPMPPVYGSATFTLALAEVKYAASKRTPEDGALINFWGGIPGSETPAGIWQNRLKFYNQDLKSTDKEYAYAQMILAQSIADSFMECWKVKYTYQTKRPNMTDKSIETAMPNPPFPSYVSGHSTISYAAATVLSGLFPGLSDKFISDAKNAKDSRLNAGIHFSYDNEEGQKLGTAVGEFVIDKLSLQKLK